MLAAALDYAAQGFVVFAVGPDKIPFLGTQGWRDGTTDPDKLRAMWKKWPHANIACVPGESGKMVIDTDPGHSMDELHEKLEVMPETPLITETPRGGKHYWFDLAPGDNVRPSASKISEKVDVRGHGSYVVLPPSSTPDGSYRWSHPSYLPMPRATFRTEAMIRAANTKRQTRSTDADIWIIDADQEHHKAQAIEYLRSEKCKEAVEGQGGDEMTKNTANCMRDYGLSEETALDVMMAVYNVEKCFPPWDHEGMAQKVRNAYRYYLRPPGVFTKEYQRKSTAMLFKKVEQTPGKGTTTMIGKFRILDREALEFVEDPTWLIDGLLPHGAYVVLAGKQGSYKTFVALDMALSIATGSKEDRVWPSINDGGPVVYFAGEGRSGIKQRVRAWERRHHDGKQAAFHLADPVPHVNDGPDAWEALAKWMLEIGVKLAVIDTVGRAMQGTNSNSQEFASKLTAMAETFRRVAGCAIMALAHVGNDDKGRAQGSNVFHADPDTVFILNKTAEFRADMKLEKQKDGPEGKVFHLAMENVDGSLVATPSRDVPPTPEAKPETPNGPLKAAHERRQQRIRHVQLLRWAFETIEMDPLRVWTHNILARATEKRMAKLGHTDVSYKTIERLLQRVEVRIRGDHQSWRPMTITDQEIAETLDNIYNADKESKN